jgi:hypothetical protein
MKIPSLLWIVAFFVSSSQLQAQQCADLVVFSYDRPLQLYAFLESVYTYVSGLQTISVIYRTSDDTYEAAYRQVQHDFSNVVFVKQGGLPAHDFKSLFMMSSFDTTVVPYILYGVDDIVVTDFFDVGELIEALERTKAYGFFLRLGTHLTECYMNRCAQPVPPLHNEGNGIYSWTFADGNNDWQYPHSLDLTLYRKADIQSVLKVLPFSSPNQCEALWAPCADMSKKGLCFTTAKMVNIPLNIVQEVFAQTNRHMGLLTTTHLLALFNAGLKMDIALLARMKPKGAHIEYQPHFVMRKVKAGATTMPQSASEDKHFVVIIPSYNNEQWVDAKPDWRGNLVSLFKQRYTNWTAIYIDDCSRDQTNTIVRELIAAYHMEHKVHLITNTQRQGAMANIDKAIRSCKNTDIVVTLDGDDCLPHDDVFGLLNEVYADPAVWMTFGQFREYPSGNPGACQPIVKSVVYNNAFRELYPFFISHLRTFYVWLYKKIDPADLLWENNYLPMSWDMGFMIPMSEMTRGGNFRFLPYELYTYNLANPINDHKVNAELQARLDTYIRSKQKYDRVLQAPYKNSAPGNHKADLMIFSDDTPHQLEACLRSVKQYVSGFSHIYVLYRASSLEQIQTYELVKQTLPDVEYIFQSAKPLLNFQPLFMVNAFKSYSTYLALMTDDLAVTQSLDINRCIELMQRTEAYSFSLSLGKEQDSPPVRMIEPTVYAWIFREGYGQWYNSHNLAMTLYRKADIKEDLMNLDYINPYTLKNAWQRVADPNKFGLFFEHATVKQRTL